MFQFNGDWSIDNCVRKINYLRISVTDRCNLWCIYCRPQSGIINKPQEEILTFEEILRLVKILVSLGINKIRLTGGEPLVRRGIVGLIKSLVELKQIEEVSLTTNGILLPFYAEELKNAGLNRLNISLDSLQESKFKKITGSNYFYQVLEGIEKAKKVGFLPLKLNTVVMKGVNDDEIIDFVKFALRNDLILRFIEFMKVTPLWREDYFISIEKVKEFCERKFRLVKTQEKLGFGPAQYYELTDGGILGFIKTDENNCRGCCRLRLTSTGELKICLYEDEGLCLKVLLRDGLSDSEIAGIIKSRIEIKREIDYRHWGSNQFYMSSVGG